MTSILQFSDVHFGTEDRDAIKAVRDMAINLSPDISLICGDITQAGKTDEFKAAHDWISTLPGPKLITPGNHDTPMFGLLHRFFSPFGRYDKWIAPLSEPFYADKNVMIVTMNTARGWQAKFDWSLGVVDMDALAQKTDELSGAKPGVMKMIACHHPLVYPAISPLQKTTKNGPEAIKSLSDHNIDAVLTGHVHASFFVDREPGKTGILSIGSGTLSTRSRGVKASFNHIKIDDTQITITPIEWFEGNYTAAATWTRDRHALAPSLPLI